MNTTIHNVDDNQTGDHNLKALMISVLLYILLLASLYFFKILYEPIDDTPALGVDLNYGVDLVGSGDIQTLNKASNSKDIEEKMPDKGADKPKTIVAPPPKPTPAPPEKATKTNVITADEDTKVTAKKVENKTTPKPVTPVTAPPKAATSKPSPPSNTPKPTPERTVDNGSLFKKNPNGSTGSNGTVGNKTGVGGNNNGDGKPGEVGDKGDPRGTLDGKSMYGNPGKGGGTGTSVSISGWKSRGPLNIPKDNSSETGKIKFKVIIDDFGDIQKIELIESSLSPSVTNYYKSQVSQKLKANLIPLDNGNPPPRSSGTITINITRGA